jgi:F-type H+-transporting ATPase subunit delta
VSIEAVAARYAQALYELGVEQNNLPTLTDEIRRVSEVYAGSDELRAVIENPIIEAGARKAIVSEVLTRLGVGALTQNAVNLLAERRRLLVLPHLAKGLARLADQRANIVRVTVTTAAALPEGYFTRLKEQLETSLGKKVILERQLDPSLLGGVVTRIGDRIIDGSLKSRLQRMRQTLLAGQ